MICDFSPGDLVRSDRPDFNVPTDEQKRLGLIVGHVPPGEMGNRYAVTQLLVFWFGPWHGKPFTLEPDHRVRHV